MADDKPDTNDKPEPIVEPWKSGEPFVPERFPDPVQVRLNAIEQRLGVMQGEIRNKFTAIAEALDALRSLAEREGRERIEVRTAHIDEPLPNSEPAKAPRTGRLGTQPITSKLDSPEETEPKLHRMNDVAHQLVLLLIEKSGVPQNLQADLLRSSKPWQAFVENHHSHHKMSASTYNRVATFDVRWFRQADGTYYWNWPLNSEPVAQAFIEGMLPILRSYRVDAGGVLKKGKVKVSG